MYSPLSCTLVTNLSLGNYFKEDNCYRRNRGYGRIIFSFVCQAGHSIVVQPSVIIYGYIL